MDLDDEDDEYMALMRMHHRVWNANHDLVERLSRRLSWTALVWGAGGFWFGIFVALVIR